MIPIGRKSTMAKEWTDDEVKGLISESVAIVREDRLEKFLRGKFGTPPPADPAGGDNGNGNPNGGKNDPPANDPPPAKRRSLFWGEVD